MSSSKNVQLVKEYIKTFIATEIVFPGILPRQWGVEFSQSELQAIYFCLTLVIKTANPNAHRELIEQFKRIEEPNIHMHWFLCDFWRQLVPLLTDYPGMASRYQLPLKR